MAIEHQEVNQDLEEIKPLDLSDESWYKFITTSEWTILPLNQPIDKEDAQDAL